MAELDDSERLRSARPAAGAEPAAIAVVAGEAIDSVGDDPHDELELLHGSFERIVLCLALYGDELDPEDVTRRMGCEPTWSRSPGARHDGGVTAGTASSDADGVWQLEVHGDSLAHADDLIERLLARFPLDPSFWEPLQQEFALELHLGVHGATWNTGFVLSSSSLLHCAVTGAPLVTTFHAAGGATH